jgi:hypothetical protein
MGHCARRSFSEGGLLFLEIILIAGSHGLNTFLLNAFLLAVKTRVGLMINSPYQFTDFIFFHYNINTSIRLRTKGILKDVNAILLKKKF